MREPGRVALLGGRAARGGRLQNSGRGAENFASDPLRGASRVLLWPVFKMGPRATNRRRSHPRQLELLAIVEAPSRPGVRTCGGKREGAGRKRIPDARRTGVAHRSRPVHKKRHPSHVTLRARGGMPSFRAQRVHKMLVGILEEQTTKRDYRDDFHVVHYSIQSNHLHIIVEATDKRAMRSGVSGLLIAFAKRLNKRILERATGKVWGGRYHSRDLDSPRAVRNAISYLFQNYKKHGYAVFGRGFVDPCSSAIGFERWSEPVVTMRPEPWSAPRPTTWLLDEGWWTKHGLLNPSDRPASA